MRRVTARGDARVGSVPFEPKVAGGRLPCVGSLALEPRRRGPAYDRWMTMLEREGALRFLAEQLDDARSGHGRFVFVGGEAGVGKSTFVTAAVDLAQDARVAVGYCDGSATPGPLEPFLEMLPLLPEDVWRQGASRHETFTRVVN